MASFSCQSECVMGLRRRVADKLLPRCSSCAGVGRGFLECEENTLTLRIKNNPKRGKHLSRCTVALPIYLPAVQVIFAGT